MAGRAELKLNLVRLRQGASTDPRGPMGAAVTWRRARGEKISPVRVSSRTSERLDEVANLKRVGCLARDESGLRCGDTLRCRRESVPYELCRSTRGEGRGSANHGRRREDPGEGEPQEGTGPPAG
jgi:hypothetical protein